MRYELTDYEWRAIKPFLPNKPRAKRDQISAICSKTARSCGVFWWRANSMHASAKRRYSSHRSKGNTPQYKMIT